MLRLPLCHPWAVALLKLLLLLQALRVSLRLILLQLRDPIERGLHRCLRSHLCRHAGALVCRVTAVPCTMNSFGAVSPRCSPSTTSSTRENCCSFDSASRWH